MPEPQAPPFELPEYQEAYLGCFRSVVDMYAMAKDPMLRGMNKSRPSRSYLGRNSLPGGNEIVGPTMAVRSEFSMTAAEVLAGDAACLLAKLDKLAENYLASFMPQVFAAISEVTDAVGNTVDAGGKPFSAALFLELLERMDVEFDETGTPRLQIIVHPDTKIPELTEDEQRRIDEALERKRQQFLARRRSRQLPRHPLGD